MDIERLEIDANGFTFTARAAGPHDGRPVMLLHGFPETSWCWRPTLAALGAAGCRAVAPDQRGYSPRARPEGVEHYTIPNLMSDVLALADTLEIDTFDLVGHDWGGMLTWVLGARHPERVRSLSVVSTPHPLAMQAAIGGADPEQVGRSSYVNRFRKADEPEQLLLGPDGSGSGLRRMFESTGLGPNVDADHSVIDEYVAVLREPGAMTAALNWYRAMHRSDVADLPPITMPTLYVWSTEDVALGRVAAEASGQWVTGRYQFVVFDGVSHWVPEERPEELNQLLMSHLAEC
jgi:pimeloyl-ACP methyl ester carboxylesterase